MIEYFTNLAWVFGIGGLIWLAVETLEWLKYFLRHEDYKYHRALGILPGRDIIYALILVTICWTWVFTI